MIKPPCRPGGKPCPDRKVGCQAKCEKYLEYRELRHKEILDMSANSRALNKMWDYAGRYKK